MRVLITDGSYKHTLGIARAIRAHVEAVFLLSPQRFNPARYSRYVDGLVEDFHDSKTEAEDRNFLLRIIGLYKIDLIIPVGYRSFCRVSKLTPRSGEKVVHIGPSPEQLELASNKARVRDLAISLGIPVPNTYMPGSRAELEDIAVKLNFPCVLKSRLEHGSNCVSYPKSVIELIREWDRIVEENHFPPESLPLVQEFLTGKGAGFFAYYQKGHCTQTFMHQRVREFPVSGGSSACCAAHYDDRLEQYGRALLDSLKWQGPAMVEFKYDADGIPRLLEINPKYWGSLELAIHAGANFPLLHVRDFKGELLPYSGHFIRSARFHWPIDGDFDHALQKPTAWYDFLKDCFSFGVGSNLWFIKDPIVTAVRIFIFTIITARRFFAR